MKNILAIGIFLCMLSPTVQAQKLKKKFAIEVSSGTDLGWWIYDTGIPQQSNTNDWGRDYTHHSLALGLGLDLLCRFDKFTLGAGVQTSWLFEDDMIGAQDSEFEFDRVDIAEQAVNFTFYSLQASYTLIESKKYSFSPAFRYGIFQIDTVHPERDNFGAKTFLEIGFDNAVRLSNIELIARPRYRVMKIKPETEKNPGEKHRIYNIGLQLGLRFWLL